jgi:hypothetical protein
MRGQPGFFDIDDRLKRLSNLGNQLWIRYSHNRLASNLGGHLSRGRAGRLKARSGLLLLGGFALWKALEAFEAAGLISIDTKTSHRSWP